MRVIDDRTRRPTLLVGVGAFGRDVARAARGASLVALDVAVGAESKPDAATLDPNAKDPYSPIVKRAEDALAALLDVGHYLGSSSPTDPRGPLCDVLVVADLGEPSVAPLVAPLAAALASGLRRAFSAILRSGDGALVVCPLLFCPRTGDRAVMARAASSLADLSRQTSSSARARFGGRVYLVEDQSGKYLLSRAEMVRSFAAFLSTLCLPQVRDDDRGVRRLVEDDGPPGTFATFACASLAFDHAALSRIAAARLGREILALLRAPVDPAALDIASLATPLVPTQSRLDTELAEAEPLADLLAPPTIDVPPIEWDDDPETLLERKFGSLFRARAEATIGAFRDEVERFRMDKLAAALEQRGKVRLEGGERAIETHVAELVAERPTGHARALLVLRDARTRAKGYLDEVVRAIEAPELSPLPPSPLAEKLAALEEAVSYRPRPRRMVVLGAALGLVSALLLSGVLVSSYRALLAPFPPFFDAVSPLPHGRLRPFFTPPVPLLAGAAVSAYSTGYRLWKHRKRHHNWACEARDDLAQSIARHIREDLVGHYERRLHYARLLWVQRVLAQLLGRIEQTITALEATRAALAAADRALHREEHEGERNLFLFNVRGLRSEDGAAPPNPPGLLSSSVLHATIVGPDDVDAIYAEIRPPEPSAAAERWLRESLAEHPWTEAPFAAHDDLLAFCHAELESFEKTSPFEEGKSALHKAAESSAKGFLRRLFLKLSPGLELAPKYAAEAPAPLRLLFAPPEARKLVDAALAEGGFEGAWDVRALSPDPDSILLVVARTGLPHESLALARSEDP
ncbi:hypothetical protein [Polyangium jinanense]|uniref:Uncharacterized protein n=1 Tax=Polyangium jinanense TaxID=2829994 RepID=A0A9X3XB71_9BACT|nr:hypothetical protein [Polyangium jinanense]MDC3959516.1 hypothetical protein [Polyangium jinanense]MDC3986115.1 hypothetical protein [Polyangium jinanense]